MCLGQWYKLLCGILSDSTAMYVSRYTHLVRKLEIVGHNVRDPQPHASRNILSTTLNLVCSPTSSLPFTPAHTLGSPYLSTSEW